MTRKCKVGTLGDSSGFLTCSMYIARRWNINSEIIPYHSFEAAADALKRRELSCILVPAAYSNISEFIMDNKLIASEVFLASLPPLVCVSKNSNINLHKTDKIYLHQATNSLLREINIQVENLDVVYVNSNIEACEELIQDEDANCISITNKLCAEHFGLNIITILRNNVIMPWVCFTNKSWWCFRE